METFLICNLFSHVSYLNTVFTPDSVSTTTESNGGNNGNGENGINNAQQSLDTGKCICDTHDSKIYWSDKLQQTLQCEYAYDIF